MFMLSLFQLLRTAASMFFLFFIFFFFKTTSSNYETKWQTKLLDYLTRGSGGGEDFQRGGGGRGGRRRRTVFLELINEFVSHTQLTFQAHKDCCNTGCPGNNKVLHTHTHTIYLDFFNVGNAMLLFWTSCRRRRRSKGREIMTIVTFCLFFVAGSQPTTHS